jgi:hypothetical protein
MSLNCIECELTRAKIKARLMWAIGSNPQQIADKLSHDYGSCYYVYDDRVYRVNTVPPHNDYLII